MADLSITTDNVALTGTATLEIVQLGETVTKGQAVYKKAADSLYYKADANASSATAEARGIAITGGVANGYIVMLKSGYVNPGATLTKGETYVVSATAGGIAPLADVTTGWYVTILGIAESTSSLNVNIIRSGVTRT